MNIHRSNRAKAKTSTLRRWLAETIGAANNATTSRPLMCEQLERRYALHGMGWFAESADHFEFSETIIVEDEYASERFGQVRAWQAEGEYIHGYETVDRYTAEDVTAFDASLDDMFNEHCDRPHGTPPEGEQRPDLLFSHGSMHGSSETFGLPTGGVQDSVNNQLATKPQPKIIDWTSTKGDSGKFDALPQHADNTTVNSASTNVANNLVPQDHVNFIPASAPAMGTAMNGLATIKLIDFTAASRSPSTQNTNSPVASRNSFAPAAAGANRVEASPSLTNSSGQVSTLVSNVSQFSRSTISTTAASTLSITESDASVSIGNSWQNDRPGTSADRTAKSDRETEGLLSELRAVIEKLADDQADAKTGSASGARGNGSLVSGNIDKLFSSSRQRMLVDDGMLELAATTDRLSMSAASVEALDQSTVDAQQRSQLIASLELNREFDLAGQSVQSLKRVVDPPARVHDSKLAAEDVENWNDQISPSVGLSVKPTEVDATIWQRSILPLSFLAIGGLLIRSRKKYKARQSGE